MPEELFDILFSGQLIEGQDPEITREKVRQIFKASDTQMDRLFSGKPMAVKKGVGLEAASRYRLAFRKAGALVDIRPASSTSKPVKPGKKEASDAPAADPNMGLLPPNTGSLEDCAPILDPEPLPDISAMSMAPPGPELDDTPQPLPAHITTNGIELVPGTDWSLEDCQPDIPPLILPDGDHLSLAAVDGQSPMPQQEAAEPLPDISALSLEEREPETDPEESSSKA